MLYLASKERLDHKLSMALTQGAFKHYIIDDVGHNIHEDNTPLMAELFEDFKHKFHISSKYNQPFVVTSLSGKKIVIGPKD